MKAELNMIDRDVISGHAEWGTGLLVTQCYQYTKGTTMEDFEDSTSEFDSSLTSSDEDTSAGGYQVIQPYSHEPLSDKKQTQSPSN